MTLRVPRVPSWIKACYLVVVVLVFGWALAGAGPQLRQWQSLFLQPATYAFIAAWGGMAFLLGWWWALLLRWQFGVAMPAREWLPVQAMAWGGRYLPGKLGLFAGKLGVLGQRGLDIRRITYSVIWEQVAFVLAGAVVAALFVSDAIPAVPVFLSRYWDVARVAAVVMYPVVLFALSRYLRKKLDAQAAWIGMGVGRGSLLFGLYLLPHVVVGLGTYPLLLASVPSAAGLGWFGWVGLLALANVAGIVAIFAPAGIGVREAVLGLGLSAFVPLPAALAFAAVLRLLSLVADGAFFVLAGGLTVWRRSGAA